MPAQQVAPDDKALAFGAQVAAQLLQNALQSADGKLLAGAPVAEQVLEQSGLLAFGDGAVVEQLLHGAGVLHPGDGPGHRGLDFIVAGGLQNVVEAVQLDGLLGVEEVRVGGEEYADKVHVAVPGPAQQGEAVFPGHFNVAQKDVHVLFLEDDFGLGSVGGGADGADLQGVPIQAGDKPAENADLVVYKQNGHVDMPPVFSSRSMGKNSSTQAPPVRLRNSTVAVGP